MKRLNKNIGAKVQVREVLVAINPQDKWKYIKKVQGVIVEDTGYEHYYHSCSGGQTHICKHVIESDCYPNYAVKLCNDFKDIEGNNVVIFREHDIKFLEHVETLPKPISEKAYLNAKKTIKRYEIENKITKI
jgi:hypothetical protein